MDRENRNTDNAVTVGKLVHVENGVVLTEREVQERLAL